jgi:phospholipase C
MQQPARCLRFRLSIRDSPSSMMARAMTIIRTPICAWGRSFLREVVTALANGPDWSKTVLVINRDEWGGFFDHAVPPRVIAANAIDTDLVNGKALLGCRVPVLVVSPFSRGNPEKPRIDSLLYDHTSVLKLIEWRWQLEPLTARDASNEIANLAHALDLNNLDTSLPDLPVIPTLP